MFFLVFKIIKYFPSRLDLRFIPDDMTFDEKPHDVCNVMPDVSQYEPRMFLTSALQQAEVHLTWDETDPSRMQTMQKLFKVSQHFTSNLQKKLKLLYVSRKGQKW